MSTSEQVVTSSICRDPTLQINRVAVRAVDHVMPIPSDFRKSRGVASLEKRLAVVLDQDELALKQKDELILVRVPRP